MKLIDLGKFRVGLMRVKNLYGLSVEQLNAVDELVMNSLEPYTVEQIDCKTVAIQTAQGKIVKRIKGG